MVQRIVRASPRPFTEAPLNLSWEAPLPCYYNLVDPDPSWQELPPGTTHDVFRRLALHSDFERTRSAQAPPLAVALKRSRLSSHALLCHLPPSGPGLRDPRSRPRPLGDPRSHAEAHPKAPLELAQCALVSHAAARAAVARRHRGVGLLTQEKTTV